MTVAGDPPRRRRCAKSCPLSLLSCRRPHGPGEKDLNFSDATHRFVYLLMGIESKVEFLLLL